MAEETKEGDKKLEKSNKGIVILLVIILLAVIGFGGYFVYKFTDKIDSQEKQITELKKTTEKLAVEKEKTTQNSKTSAVVEDEEDDEEEDEEEEVGTSTSSSSKKTVEETIEELFLDELKKEDDLLAYKVESVTLVTGTEKQDILDMDGGQYYRSSDDLAVVRYSVKPKDMEGPNWVAGNGTEQGDWILNKAACVCLRGNKLVGNVFNTGW